MAKLICPACKTASEGHEMCPACGYPIVPIPTPPGGKLSFAGYDWFVLEKREDRILLVTEKVIEKRPYHTKMEPVTWERSDLRAYLNGAFYARLPADDRARILRVTNENPDNRWYHTPGGNPTDDYVFVLSVDEILRYFGDSGQILTRYMYPGCDWCRDEYLPWIDDRYSLNRRAVDETGIVTRYWTRTPGANPYAVADIGGFCGDGFDQGGIMMSGVCNMENGHFLLDEKEDLNIPVGVRAAVWVRI